MRGLGQQLTVSLRLYYRNTMALIYGYVFPLIFLIAFWVLYRYDRVPLIRHMGELLTIAVLGGACFGLPTTLVGERERGVWRRYRLTPVPTGSLVLSTVAARYVILVTAGLLQLGLAMLVGMPWPDHPVQLWVAFTCVAFAFLGLGLVIAMLADNVPAVQALGQCIFLPMLIIGGVAVQLSALPDWAQVLSAYFPGRYAVAAIQACVNGDGLQAVGFSLFALVLIGTAGCVAAAGMFRWDSHQRFMASQGKGWLGAALAAWVAVGAIAQATGRITTTPATTPQVAVQTADATPAPTDTPVAPPEPAARPADAGAVEDPGAVPSSAPAPEPPAPAPATPAPRATPPPAEDAAEPAAAPAADAGTARPAPTPAPEPPPPAAAEPAPTTTPAASDTAEAAPPPAEEPAIGPPRWQDVTIPMIERDILFDRLPPDSGVVTPIAGVMVEPEQDLWDELDQLSYALPAWKPGQVEDPVQRVRNFLYVAAVPDVYQMPIESFIPAIVYAEIQQSVPKDDLIKILYWIGVHPDRGDDSAIAALGDLGLPAGPVDLVEVRGRAAVYAVKLLGRILGKRPIN